MTEKRFINDIDDGQLIDTKGELSTIDYSDKIDFYELWEFLNKLADENEQLKKGMIGVVDRYIKNVECNPPSSVRTHGKIKKALMNIREDLRDLIEDLE